VAQTYVTIADPGIADYCVIQYPASLSAASDQATQPVYGQIYEAAWTAPAGAPAGLIGQLGFGAVGVHPAAPSWTWFATTWNTQAGPNDEFVGTIAAPGPGQYAYAFRFSFDAGSTWAYCDLDGAGSNVGLSFEVAQLPTLTVF
jgi:hypothetical protein